MRLNESSKAPHLFIAGWNVVRSALVATAQPAYLTQRAEGGGAQRLGPRGDPAVEIGPALRVLGKGALVRLPGCEAFVIGNETGKRKRVHHRAAGALAQVGRHGMRGVA